MVLLNLLIQLIGNQSVGQLKQLTAQKQAYNVAVPWWKQHFSMKQSPKLEKTTKLGKLLDELLCLNKSGNNFSYMLIFVWGLVLQTTNYSINAYKNHLITTKG